MKIMRPTTALAALGLAALFSFPASAAAQWSVEGRLGATLPTGDLGDVQTGGLAIAGDLMYTISPNFTVYGGVGHHRFNCDGDCDADVSSTGLDGGVKLLFGDNTDAMPWVRGGLLLHKPEVEDVDGDWELGFDTGVGIDWRVGHTLTLVPALRFNSYDADGASFRWFTIDLGAHFHFGG